MEKHIGLSVIRYDEAKTLRDIEPFDDTRQFDEIGRRIIDDFSDRSWSEIGPRHFRFDPVRRHGAADTGNKAILAAVARAGSEIDRLVFPGGVKRSQIGGIRIG